MPYPKKATALDIMITMQYLVNEGRGDYTVVYDGQIISSNVIRRDMVISDKDKTVDIGGYKYIKD